MSLNTPNIEVMQLALAWNDILKDISAALEQAEEYARFVRQNTESPMLREVIDENLNTYIGPMNELVNAAQAELTTENVIKLLDLSTCSTTPLTSNPIAC